MALTETIYNNATGSTTTIVIDFRGEILIEGIVPSTCPTYFFKFTTSARDTGGHVLPLKIVKELSDLALANNVQSATNTTSAYLTVKDMIEDYVFDYIHGHTADQYLSGCTEQLPMNI